MTELTKEWVDKHPEGVALTYQPSAGQGKYSRNEIMMFAMLAHNMVSTLPWLNLEPEIKRQLFDVTVDIAERGAPGPTKFEQMVFHLSHGQGVQVMAGPTPNQIREFAKTAQDKVAGESNSIPFDEATQLVQNELVDIATAIVGSGGGATPFELAVGEAYAAWVEAGSPAEEPPAAPAEPVEEPPLLPDTGAEYTPAQLAAAIRKLAGEGESAA